MMKKPTKSQARRLKVVVPEIPQEDTSEEGMVASLLALQATPGWGLVLRALNENIEYLNEVILNKFDPVTGMTVSEVEVDTSRIKRKLLIEFRDTPRMMITKLTEKTVEVQKYDPYFDLDDIATAKNRRGI